MSHPPPNRREVPLTGTTAPEVLRAVCDYHFASREHGLLGALRGLLDEGLHARPGHGLWTPAAELRHAGYFKLKYASQAFGPTSRFAGPPPPVGPRPPAETVAAYIDWLVAGHDYFTTPLGWLTAEQLGERAESSHHGGSLAGLFTVMAGHDAVHGARLRVVRRLTGHAPA